MFPPPVCPPVRKIIQAETHDVTITTPIHNTLSRNMRCPTNNVVCAISKVSGQPAHERSLVRLVTLKRLPNLSYFHTPHTHV